MPFSLPLPPPYNSQGWKVKIRDKERLEDPHVTVTCKTREWRIGLRDGQPLAGSPPIREIADEVFKTMADSWDQLCVEWDRRHPSNPIDGSEV